MRKELTREEETELVAIDLTTALSGSIDNGGNFDIVLGRCEGALDFDEAAEDEDAEGWLMTYEAWRGMDWEEKLAVKMEVPLFERSVIVFGDPAIAESQFLECLNLEIWNAINKNN